MVPPTALGALALGWPIGGTEPTASAQQPSNGGPSAGTLASSTIASGSAVGAGAGFAEMVGNFTGSSAQSSAFSGRSLPVSGDKSGAVSNRAQRGGRSPSGGSGSGATSRGAGSGAKPGPRASSTPNVLNGNLFNPAGQPFLPIALFSPPSAANQSDGSGQPATSNAAAASSQPQQNSGNASQSHLFLRCGSASEPKPDRGGVALAGQFGRVQSNGRIVSSLWQEKHRRQLGGGSQHHPRRFAGQHDLWDWWIRSNSAGLNLENIQRHRPGQLHVPLSDLG